ncbi:MAG: prepilin-type N-terminal cleavage/methylation domain-containing protein [Candidatus Riflebacteria bacterium]|nr:prepilin-type N-terminal cleavage/methylation domain-containing protein [Candidatus Riflebacteria bacterium]
MAAPIRKKDPSVKFACLEGISGIDQSFVDNLAHFYCGVRKNASRKLSRLNGFTLLEVLFGLSLFMLLLYAAYRMFFAQVREIRVSLEHISVNENVRLFFTRFGSDVRNANYVELISPTVRMGVPKLLPAITGEPFCRFVTQVFDFSVKPPDTRFIRTIKIEYSLEKAKNGTLAIIRSINSEVPASPGGISPYIYKNTVCDGIKEITVFSSIRQPVKFSPTQLLAPSLTYEPYEIDGHGPNLIHVRASFVRPPRGRPDLSEEPVVELRTCFALRGRLNQVNP